MVLLLTNWRDCALLSAKNDASAQLPPAAAAAHAGRCFVASNSTYLLGRPGAAFVSIDSFTSIYPRTSSVMAPCVLGLDALPDDVLGACLGFLSPRDG